ncbi:MAG: hypothetical protein WBP49_10955, partial [Acidimicrobiia bacterium]
AFTVMLPNLNFLTCLGTRLCSFTVIQADLIPVASLGPVLVGLTLLVRADAFTVMLPNLNFLTGLGTSLRSLAVGIRITRLARGLLNLDPGPFLRLRRHHVGVLRTVSGFRTAIGTRDRGGDNREHHDEAREERHPFHMDLLSL